MTDCDHLWIDGHVDNVPRATFRQCLLCEFGRVYVSGSDGHSIITRRIMDSDELIPHDITPGDASRG